MMVGAHFPRMSTPRTVLVLTYWSYADALIQTYTLPYLRIMLEVMPAGSRIHLVTLEKDPQTKLEGMDPGITVHTFAYRPFGLRALGMILAVLLKCIAIIRRERVDVIHAWCTPAGMFGYILSLLTGRSLILDSYEPHAEAMVENGTWDRGGVAFRTLFHFERLQSRRAKVLIAAAEGMREYARVKYGVVDTPFYVKPACVDLARFSFADRKDPDLLRNLGLEGKLVAVYAGKFGGIYLDQEVFDFFHVARDHWGERFHVLLLTAHPAAELLPFMEKAGLDPSLFTIRFVPHAAIARYMGLADLAITPVRSVPTKRYCTPIKDGEYWALGLPVVITPDISDDSRIIAEHGVGAVLEGLGHDHYLKAVKTIDRLLASGDTRQLYDRIRPIAEKYRDLARARDIYQRIHGKAEA